MIPTEQNIISVSNYVYAQIGAQLQAAQEVYATGSGGVVPSPGGGGISGYTPYPINITVSAGQAGSHTLSATIPSDWYNLYFITQCVINQSVYQINSGFTYNQINGVFDLSLSGYTFQDGDIFSCNAYKSV